MDASTYGIGVQLSNIGLDGKWKSVSFASATLLPAEANYSQFEKESLSLVFAARKYHKHL